LKGFFVYHSQLFNAKYHIGENNMRIQDIIRGLLDLVDQADTPAQTTAVIVPTEPAGQESPFTHTGQEDDIRRFRQIVDLADDGNKEFSNSPNEKYADVSAVTTDAGGGVNGPKHPADIKGNSISMYPNFLAKGE
jgi:hypothetical protein